MQKKILIVDDDKSILMVMEKRLSDAGYLVSKAESGEDAIIMAKNQCPDLIILDVIMPGMDGGGTAQALRDDPRTKDIPIMFLTCVLTREKEKAGKMIGGYYFVAKPYDPKELLEVVKKHIRL